jgi:predicted permease
VLLIKSFQRVMATEQGFDPAGALALSVDLPSVNYPGNSSRVQEFHTRVLARVAELPGVTAVGFANMLPLSGGGPSGSLRIEEKPLDPKGPFNAYAIYRVVGGDYFKAMGMPVLKGRALGPGDDASAPRVVLIDEEFARQEWPGQDPLGKRLRPSGMDSGKDDEPWFTVVGVVRSVRASSLTGGLRPTYYFDYRQRPPYRSNSVSYAVRTALPAASAAPALRDAIRSVDPEVPMLLRTLPEVVARSVADKRFTMLMLSCFGGLGLLLALVGIYGVVSYAVAQRTREIGVRRALGASPWRLQAMVLGGTLRAILPGLGAGVLLALAAGRALGALLYGVRPFDPATLAAALGALGAAGLVASLVPAWRAARVDPLRAMRSE